VREQGGRDGTGGCLVSIAVLALAAGSALADAPVVTTDSITVDVPGPNFSCPADGFDVLSTFSVVRRNIDFYAGSADTILVKEIRHVDFSGTLYKSTDQTVTIPYTGTWTRTLDVAADTVTNDGRFRSSQLDHGRMVTLAAGRSVVSASDFTTLTETGRIPEAWQDGVCAYLAGG